MSIVTKEWLNRLSWKEQTVLLSALRGCDGVGKDDVSEKIGRRIRGAILNNVGTSESEFMSCDLPDEQLIYKLSKNMDAYPVHFLLHIIHASEVIGFCCPDSVERYFF